MGRKLSFDKDHALAAAARLFGRHGYHAASIRDLAASMGIPLASLYHSFGDKDRLFLSCIARHTALLTDRLDRLGASPDIGAALRGFLTEPADALLLRGYMDTYGVKALQTPLEDTLSALRRAMAALIEKGQNQGAISRREPAQDIAAALLGAYLAAPLLSRTAPSALAAILDRHLALSGAGDFKTLVRIKT